MVGAVAVELARRRVERQHDIVARVIAGGFDRLHDEAERRVGRGEVWRKPALVADIGVVAGIGELAPQGVKDLGAGADRLGDGRGADRHRP